MKEKYFKNTRQEGEALEMLNQLENNSVALAFFDPQYEKADDMLRVKGWPTHYQTDYQISQILKEIKRVLKPSAFGLIWVNKNILGTDQVLLWLLRAPLLKIVDFLVWNKHNFGFGQYFRSKGEYAFLLQKEPTNSKLFKNRSLANVWEEKITNWQRKHPHQKPYELIRALIEATTQENDLVIDPCAGSFIVLEACLATNRQFLGCDLTYNELKDFQKEIKSAQFLSELEIGAK
jgi:site-specific DNA-methyltransferase (adenine-specific)